MTLARAVVLDRPAATPMDLLAGGVPLSLVLDLVLGPRSEDLLREEHRQVRPATASSGGEQRRSRG